MKITDLKIDGFGVWHDLKLSDVSSQLTAFYGENEAGKTTLMQFIRSVLYGMSPERRKRYLPPLGGGLPGGSLGIVDDQHRFRVTRIADRGPDDVGHVTITTADGKTTGDRLLRDALAEVDEPTFSNVFAIGLDEIQRLGTLGGTQAAESLYRLTSGLDRVSLYDVIQGLRQTCSQLLGSAGSNTHSEAAEAPPAKLIALAARRDQLQARIRQLTGQNRQWSQCAVRLEELDGEIAAVEEELDEKEHATRTIEIAVGLKSNWRHRAKLSHQLRQLGGGAQLPDDAIERLDELSNRIERHRRDADILQGQRYQLRDETERLGINELLVRNASRIEALGEQRDWLQALERQMDRLESDANECEERCASEQNRLTSTLGLSDRNHLREISEADLKNLRPQIVAIQAAQRQFDQTRDELSGLSQNERSIKLQLESAIAGGQQHGLPMDVQETSDLVANLRKRLQVEQRVEQARAHQLDMEQQSHELLDEQILPLWLFGLLFGAFVLGALMVGLWLLVPESPLGEWGGLLALLGVAGAGFSGMFKFFAEDAAADKLDACHRQIDIAAKQIEDTQREKEQLDAEMPIAGGSVVLRLQAAEQHLAELENILPVETERKLASGEVANAEQRVETAQQKLDAAMVAWQSKLVALGLPKELDPNLFGNVTDHYGKLSDLHLQAQARREEVAARRREHAALARRITALWEEVDEAREKKTGENVSPPNDHSHPQLAPRDSQLLTLLDGLLSELRQQLSRVERRAELCERAKGLKAEEGRHRRAVAGLTRRQEALFHAADCEDEVAYRQLADRQRKADKLRKQRKAIGREIAAAIGDHEPEETFAELLRPPMVDQLEEFWETATAEQETSQEELRRLAQLQGEVKQQQRTLAEDRSLAETRLDLSCVEKQLTDACDRWRETATVSRMLERIRADYEAHRQPETLHEASTFLGRMTAGKYQRIWTPLANDILLVETSDGQSLPVEALSRGTREQLLLSVRLALVAQMARRGVKLPMVLDDVLVNFDVTRAKRAAEVLKEFAAAGHQLLLFTCHEHMWQMFRELDADCRRLPQRGEAKSSERVVETAQPEPALSEPTQPEPAVVEVPKPKQKRRVKKKVQRKASKPQPAATQLPEVSASGVVDDPALSQRSAGQRSAATNYEYPFDEIFDEPLEVVALGEEFVPDRVPESATYHDHLEPRRA